MLASCLKDGPCHSGSSWELVRNATSTYTPPHLLNQNLCFNKTPGESRCTLGFKGSGLGPGNQFGQKLQ